MPQTKRSHKSRDLTRIHPAAAAIGVRMKCRRNPCATGTCAGLPGGGDGLGFDLARPRPDIPARPGSRSPKRRGRLCAGRIWTAKSGACGAVGGLGR